MQEESEDEDDYLRQGGQRAEGDGIMIVLEWPSASSEVRYWRGFLLQSPPEIGEG